MCCCCVPRYHRRRRRNRFGPLFKNASLPRDIRLDQTQFERLRAELPDYLKAPVRLAYYNGLRREEVFGLKWSAVDWHAKIIRLSGKVTKTGQPRMTPIPDPVMEDLKLLYPRRTGELVFEKDGERIRGFAKTWRATLKRAKLPERFVFHGLRYCAASNMTSAGVPQVVAQGITGHQTDSIFKRYNLVSESDLEAAAKKVTAYNENGARKGQMAQTEAVPTEAVNVIPS